MSIGENCEGNITPFRSDISRFSRGTVAVDDCTKNFGELTGLNALAIYDYISRGDGTSYGSRIGAVVRAGCMGWRTSGTAKKDRDCAVRFHRAHMNVRLNNRS